MGEGMRSKILKQFAACATVVASMAAFASDADNCSVLLDLAAPVERWDEGIPLGNGGAGALLWGGGDTLNVTLDRADFWHNVEMASYLAPDFTWKNLIDVVATKDDARRNSIFPAKDSTSPTKLPGVRLVLKLGEGQTLKRFRLDGETASATVTVATPDGDSDILVWFDDGDKLLSMRVPDGVTFADKQFVKNASFDKLGGYPEPETEIDDGKAIYRRKRRAGANNRFDTDFEAGVRFRDAAENPDSAFWRKFNATSSVSIPDAEMQRLYDMAMYLYGAGARAGHPPLALQGLWTADDGKLPPWHGDYHNDLNTEMTYWAAGPAGMIEALEAFADFYIERLPECRAFCRKIFGGGDGAVIPPTMGLAAQPISGWTAYAVPPIHGIWVFDTMCDAWDYDPTPEKAKKYLAFGRELAAGLEHSWKMVDGVRKLEVSCSPEVGGNRGECFLNANSSYERAILKSFYVWLARLAEACGNRDEAAKWRGYVETFGLPNITKDGVIEISAGNPLAFSHRHASHLLQVFPLVNVPPESGVDLVKSVEHWENLDKMPSWCGYSYSWAGCFEARLGRGDRAHHYLKDFQRAFVSRNGFHLNGDQLKCGLSRYTYRPFTLEGNFGYARGIQEMLLSYDPHTNAYCLFPALPKDWDGKEVSFRDLRLPGGHRVSAKRTADGTVTHTIVPNPRAKSVPGLAVGVAATALAMTESKVWRSPGGGTLPYRLHRPATCEPGRRYPLVVYMHGAGSRGSDNVTQLRYGGVPLLNWARRTDQQFFMVAPHCPVRERWVNTKFGVAKSSMKPNPTPQLAMAMEIIDDACKKYPIDPDRIYVMGISMGGYATWELLQRRPQMFAAALPCCGGGDTARASRLTDIPIWVFHGDADKTVPVCRSRDMVAAIKAAGGQKIIYREYSGKDHDVWTPTFSDDSVFEWLFSQKRQVGR